MTDNRVAYRRLGLMASAVAAALTRRREEHVMSDETREARRALQESLDRRDSGE